MKNLLVVGLLGLAFTAQAEELETGGGYDYKAVEKAEADTAAKKQATARAVKTARQKKLKAKRAAEAAEAERISLLPENMAKVNDRQACVNAGREWRDKQHDNWIKELYRRKLIFNQLSVKEQKVNIDDTECDVFAALGHPNSYNRSVTKYTTSVQFVYDRRYFYTENGIVTSWSD